MQSDLLSLSTDFETASEADWLDGVTKALKGGGIDRITRQTRDGIAIRPLYRETDFPSGQTPRGMPGQAPYLRGGHATPDPYLPWDIRQRFTHPAPKISNGEILRDLERGISGVELALDCSGKQGIQLCSQTAMDTVLDGVRPDLATIALDPCGAGTGASVAGLLAQWASQQDTPEQAKLAFNIDPLGTLARRGTLKGGLDTNFANLARIVDALSTRFPAATCLRADGRIVHEAGGTEAQELAAMIASATDTLRRLSAAGLSPANAAKQIQFTLALDGNYGLGIAKLRAARRLWAQVLSALDIDPIAMKLQAVSSARMLTRYDAWVNILRGTAACFAGAVGGADAITVRPFNAALGIPEELGRRIARNTQIMAMEESGLGRVADPSGGAWFTETLAEDLAAEAWAQFQQIETEGGYGASLMAGDLHARVKTAREALRKTVAKRRTPITGISEFPLLEEIGAPVAETPIYADTTGVDASALKALVPDFNVLDAGDSTAETLVPISLAEPFEALRDRAEAHFAATGKRPTLFLATLGALSAHTARADFARNLFAAGGIELQAAPVIPKSVDELAAAFAASGCAIAVLCGSDSDYETQAGLAAKALKTAGARTLWLAGKHEAEGIDRHIFMGCDSVHELTLALTELDVK